MQPVAGVAPLRGTRRLESLALYVHKGLDGIAVQQVLGDKVTVRMLHW